MSSMSHINTSGFSRKKTRSDNVNSLSSLVTQSNYISNITEASYPYIFTKTHRTFNTQTPMRTNYDESIKNETNELTSFYQTQTQSRHKHQKPSKEEKQMFYTKYNIKKPKVIQVPNHKRPYDLSISIPSSAIYFKTMSKAIQTLEVNEQIVRQVHRLNSQYQIDAYCNNINHIEVYRSQLSKMPKVRVQKLQVLVKGTNSMRRVSVIKKRAEIIPFLRISHDMFMNNDIKLSITNINDIKPGPKPTSRSLFSLNLFGNECFVFGGINSDYSSDMWVFKFSTHEWHKINITDEPVGRCNHSSVMINDNIIIYGGTHPMNIIKPPEDVLLFNILTRKFFSPQVGNMKKVRKRKGHIGVNVDQTMLIHGGYDEDNKMLNSSYIITMPKMCWNELIIQEDAVLPYLAYHSAQVVSDYDKKAMEGEKYNIYKPPAELIKNTSSAIIKYKGIYIFGGLMQNDEMNNEIYVITIGKIPCDVFKLKTMGIGPSARINCGMVYINQLNCLVVYGGENRVQIFNDFFIFDIETLAWKKPINSSELLTRTEHQTFYYEGRVLILGGRNEKVYHKMDFDSIEFTL